MDSKDNKIIIYQDENGVTKISVRFADEDLWLNSFNNKTNTKKPHENVWFFLFQ